MASAAAAVKIASALSKCQRLLCLTGAGVSTLSGIPDYRSDGKTYKPLQHREFTDNFSIRQRYWARSFLGWPRFSSASPNASHFAIAELQRLGFISHLISQNVDRLHMKAVGINPALAPNQTVYHCGDGVRRPMELHGTLFEVECIACGSAAPLLDRQAVQATMARDNSAWSELWRGSSELRPDGDVELPLAAYATFSTPRCPVCQAATLKPSVTFFGGNVPLPTVAQSLEIAGGADGVLVLGSTVSTFSAFRLVRMVAEKGGPVVVVTRGETRADPIAGLKLGNVEVGETMTHLSLLLGGKGAAAAAAGAASAHHASTTPTLPRGDET